MSLTNASQPSPPRNDSDCAQSPDTTALAEALVAAHAGRFGPASPLPERAPSGPATYQAAWRACRALGFIERDADCLAQAWQRQAERTGQAGTLAWPDRPEDFGLGQPRDPSQAFAACPRDLGLYVVAPSADWIARLAGLGVPTLQLRFKSNDPQAIRQEVRAALQAVRGSQSRLFINDHWQIAIEEGAWGVHLGQEDLEDLDLSPLRQAGLRLGVSTHGYAEMVVADQVQPSYIALGAVFPTTLKAMATAPQGVARLRAYAQLLNRLPRPYPLVAIGGIDRERLPEVLSSGVGSVAVVRAVLGASNPKAEVDAFQAALQENVARRP